MPWCGSSIAAAPHGIDDTIILHANNGFSSSCTGQKGAHLFQLVGKMYSSDHYFSLQHDFIDL